MGQALPLQLGHQTSDVTDGPLSLLFPDWYSFNAFIRNWSQIRRVIRK
jgi:hypothetical protein